MWLNTESISLFDSHARKYVKRGIEKSSMGQVSKVKRDARRTLGKREGACQRYPDWVTQGKQRSGVR